MKSMSHRITQGFMNSICRMDDEASLVLVKFASETRVQQEGLQCPNRPGRHLSTAVSKHKLHKTQEKTRELTENS